MWCSQWDENGDVAHEDDVAIALDLLENPVEHRGRVLVVAGIELPERLHDPGRGFAQALAVGIVPGPAQESAHGGLGFLTARTIDRLAGEGFSHTRRQGLNHMRPCGASRSTKLSTRTGTQRTANLHCQGVLTSTFARRNRSMLSRPEPTLPILRVRTRFVHGPPMLNEIYNRRILDARRRYPPPRPAAARPTPVRPRFRSSAARRSQSTSRWRATGSIDFAHEVKACALGQASSSIMARHRGRLDRRRIAPRALRNARRC